MRLEHSQVQSCAVIGSLDESRGEIVKAFVFPQNYHEPYYETYTNEDFRALATDCGLAYIRTVNAFVSKVMVFDKPAP